MNTEIIDINNLTVSVDELKAKIAEGMEEKIVECKDDIFYIILHHGKRISLNYTSIWETERGAKATIARIARNKYNLDYIMRKMVPEKYYCSTYKFSNDIIKIQKELQNGFKEQFKIITFEEYIRSKQ